MILDHRDDRVMVAVAAQVMGSDGGARRQRDGAPRQLQQRRPGRNLAAVPAPQTRNVGGGEDRCRAGALCHAVRQPEQTTPPEPFSDPAEPRVKAGRERLLEEGTEEAGGDRPPGEHRVTGPRPVGVVAAVEDEDWLLAEVPQGETALRLMT